MTPKITFDVSLVIGLVGALTGMVSLFWHILNTRPKILLDRISFTKGESIGTKKDGEKIKNYEIVCRVRLKNKGNRSTTIEGVHFLIGNKVIDVSDHIRRNNILPNSSYVFEFFDRFQEDKFKKFFDNGKLQIGVDIFHTFGRLKKIKKTEFKTPLLNLI